MRLSLCLALASTFAVLHSVAAAHHKGHHKALAVGRSKLKDIPRPAHLKGKMRTITHVHGDKGWTRIGELPGVDTGPVPAGVSPVASRRALQATGSPPPPHKPPPPSHKPPPPTEKSSPPLGKPPPPLHKPPPPAGKVTPPPPAHKNPPPPQKPSPPPPKPPPPAHKPPPPVKAASSPPPLKKPPPPAHQPPPPRPPPPKPPPPAHSPPPKKPPPPHPPPPKSSPPPPPPPPAGPPPTLPSSCSPGLDACCDDTATLASVPKASVNGAAPYTSVVQIISKLYVDYEYYGIGGCSGTLTQREDIILTAGHCWQEYEDGKTFQSNDAKVYFNVYDGAYSHYEPVINVALWNEWVYYEYSEADQALFQLAASQPAALVMPTQDITKLYSQYTGYKEPYNSVGFPGFNKVMKYTPNPGGRCMGIWNATDVTPSFANTYALYLPILAGMSGGPVFTNDSHIFATNDFSTGGCSAGRCYNGYTAIDNTNWPLSQLLAVLGPQSPSSG